MELLSPAGSPEALKAVISAGADAVYMGADRFGARAYAQNFTPEEYAEAVRYAHLRGVAVYLTVNTLLRDDELSGLAAYVRPIVEAGVDAVLVQDFGAAAVLKEEFPELRLHASTQMTVTGPYSAAFAAEQGIVRVVPARELSAAELRAIGRESGLEVEAFVHGALCVCLSGQCLMSSQLGGRSGNRGRCAQPCRLPYSFEGEKGELLSMKDLSAAHLIGELKDAGVASLKIEGRMKQAGYAAGVTSIYRKLIADGGSLSKKDEARLKSLFGRGGFTDGYLKGRSGPDMTLPEGRELTKAEAASRNEEYKRAGEAFAEKDIPLKAALRAMSGEKLCLTVSLSGEYAKRFKAAGAAACAEAKPVTAEGGVVQNAENRPADAEGLRSHLAKTGGSGFEFTEIEIEIDGRSFVPVGWIKDLRRRAIAAMEEEILRAYAAGTKEAAIRTGDDGKPAGKVSAFEAENALKSAGKARTFKVEHDDKAERRIVKPEALEEAAAEVRADAGSKDRADGRYFAKKDTVLTAFCSTADQAIALSGAGLSRIYLDAAALYEGGAEAGASAFTKDAAADKGDRRPAETAARLADLLKKEGGAKLFIATPLFDSPKNAGGFYSALPSILQAGAEGFLARSLEGAARLKAMGLADRTVIDAGVYTWNRAAREVFASAGFMGDTLPAELKLGQILQRGAAGSEFVMYGRRTLMVTRQCLFRNCGRCRAERTASALKDRKGVEFPYMSQCPFCYTVVLNSVPTSCFSEGIKLAREGAAALRLSFTDEAPQEARRIAEAAWRLLLEGRSDGEPVSEYTKSYLRHGVE